MKFFKQIKKNPLFYNLTDKDIENLFDGIASRVEKKSPRDIVQRPSEEVTEICIILEGNLVEFSLTGTGEKKVVASKVDGEMFGLPYCFAEPYKANTFITSVTESCLLYIDAASLFELKSSECPCQPRFMENLVRYLSRMTFDLKCNNDFMAIKGMRKKIAKFIYDKYVEQGTPVVQLGVDRNGMARYLNVSRPSMSREMINMREEGIFGFRKDLVTINDPERLRSIAYDD